MSTHNPGLTVPTGQFQPARLRLARDLAKISQADLRRSSGLSAAALSQYESGSTRPSDSAVRRLAEALDTSVDFFYMPADDTHGGFFRSLRRSTVADRRRARAYAFVIHDVATHEQSRLIPPLDLPYVPVRDLADMTTPMRAAQQVRQAWDVPPGPIGNVIGLLETHGVIVVRLPLASPDVDAFSLPFDDHPVIVLGTDKDDKARSRFDAAHELGHLVMHQQQAWGIKEVENQAHAFASEFLMPADQIFDSLPHNVDWPQLFALKEHWQVSLAALLLRAKNLKRMDPAVYLNAVKAASARGWRRYEPVDLGLPEQAQLTEELQELVASDAQLGWLPKPFREQVGVRGA